MTESKDSGSGSGKSGKALIYVVDDEPMLLEMASAILESSGYAFQTFSDPAQALDAFKSAPSLPALIITDYAMHSMNGAALIAACRKIHPRQKILLVSGTIDEQVCLNSPAKPDRFLAKPYQAKHLLDTLQSLLAE